MIKKINFIILSLLISVLLFSCNENNGFGLSLLPSDDLVNAEITDTLSFYMITRRADSIITSSKSPMLLGSYNDPIFGRTDASLFIQVLQRSIPSWNDSTVFDSIYLTIPYDSASFYPQKLADPDLTVYEVTDTLFNRYYYSNTNPDDYTDYNQLGTGTVGYFIPTDSTFEGKGMQLRLDDDFGQRLFDQKDYYFYSDDKFYNLFKGLYIKCNNQPGIFNYLVNISTLNNDFGVIIYTHQYNTPDSADKFVLPINRVSARFNVFEHDYSGTEVENAYTNVNPQTDQYAYVQGMAGTNVKFVFPSLKKFSDYVIIKAELYLNIAAGSTNNNFTPHDELWLLQKNAAGDNYLLPEFWGNSYTGVKLSNNQYVFNVTKVVKDIVENTYSDTLSLYLTDYSLMSSAKRTILNTHYNSQNPSKLILIYTKKK